MIQAGELFIYKNPISSASRCLVTMIESNLETTIFHVSITHVVTLDGEMDILHMPFNESSFLESITTKCGHVDIIDENALEAIEVWRKAKGGIWNISIREAINLTLETIN